MERLDLSNSHIKVKEILMLVCKPQKLFQVLLKRVCTQ